MLHAARTRTEAPAEGQAASKIASFSRLRLRQELVPVEKAPEPRYYLDFQNGTVVMLGDSRLSGAVYTCEDLTGFRAAMEKGEDPAPHLTCITVCDFPAGTDEALQELTICRYAAEG